MNLRNHSFIFDEPTLFLFIFLSQPRVYLLVNNCISDALDPIVLSERYFAWRDCVRRGFEHRIDEMSSLFRSVGVHNALSPNHDDLPQSRASDTRVEGTLYRFKFVNTDVVGDIVYRKTLGRGARLWHNNPFRIPHNCTTRVRGEVCKYGFSCLFGSTH